jgi:hypothetical protein
MIEHVQICDACGERTVVKIETFAELEEFAQKMLARINETKSRGEFRGKEKIAAVCPDCWERRRGGPVRTRLVLRVCEPRHRSWWSWFWCGLLGIHQLAPSEDEATYIYSPDGRLKGMLCERCEGLIGFGC